MSKIRAFWENFRLRHPLPPAPELYSERILFATLKRTCHICCAHNDGLSNCSVTVLSGKTKRLIQYIFRKIASRKSSENCEIMGPNSFLIHFQPPVLDASINFFTINRTKILKLSIYFYKSKIFINKCDRQCNCLTSEMFFFLAALVRPAH